MRSKILPYCDGRVDGMILIGPMITPEFSLKPCSAMIPFVTSP